MGAGEAGRAGRWLAALALLGTIAVGSSSFAVEPEGDRTRALELFQRGELDFRAGRFEEAARKLREAYLLYPAPNILYNLAQALERAGDPRGALEAYRRYLAVNPAVADHQSIERRIERLEALGEPPAPLATPPAPASPPAAVAPLVETPAPTATRARRRDGAVPWYLFTVGGLWLGAGGTLVGLAGRYHDEARSQPLAPSSEPKQRYADQLAVGGYVTIGLSAALAGAGLIWGIVEAARRSHGR